MWCFHIPPTLNMVNILKPNKITPKTKQRKIIAVIPDTIDN